MYLMAPREGVGELDIFHTCLSGPVLAYQFCHHYASLLRHCVFVLTSYFAPEAKTYVPGTHIIGFADQ